MKTASPPPGEPSEPTPQEIDRGLAELEALVAEHAPALPAVPEQPVVSGETRRVRELREKVAEAHLLAGLQDDETPFTLDTKKVSALRGRTYEAARLYQLAQHPAAIAYQDAKVRKVTTAMTMSAAGIALAVSSIGVQASIVKALDVEPYTAGWWAAYGVEPVLSLPLLAAVGVQAYSAIRGRVVDRKSDEGKRLFRVELVLLGLTLTLNCWPAFKTDFDLLDLIVHSLGPVAAVLAVWVLPTLWKILSDLPMPWRSTPFSTTPVRRQYRENSQDQYGFSQDQYDLSTAPVEVLASRVRDLIDSGQMDLNPSVAKIREAVGDMGARIGTGKASEIQKILAGGAS